ncbi:MAG: hypothetical protein AAF357_19160 [Verrucomicrobiota bacterium]
MFSQKPFIEASRQFVCVRLETFENEFHERKVREVLGGVFANSAFTIFDTDGETPITGSGRMPMEGLTGRKKPSLEITVKRLNEIAADYAIQGDQARATLQDFHTFRQALNVASADQRLLLHVAGTPQEIERARSFLEPVMAHSDVIGKFHLDLDGGLIDHSLQENIEGTLERSGFHLIHAGTYGIRGRVIAHLPLESSAAIIKETLLSHNALFAQVEQRKAYADHVVAGLKEGVYFEQVIPYGEDRDGDGRKDNPKVAREAERRRAEANLLSLPTP